MTRSSQTHARRPKAALLLAALAVAGCSSWKPGGDDDGSDEAPNESSPKAVETFVESRVDGKEAQVRYHSNVDGVSFHCRMSRSEAWRTCPFGGMTVPLGMESTTLEVKAVTPNGREDSDPARVDLPGVGDKDNQDGSGEPAKKLDLQTKILNKNEVAPVYRRDHVVFHFGVDRGAAPEEITYRCRTHPNARYQRCSDGNRYEFTGLENGSHQLQVQAVHGPSGQAAQPDQVRFQVKLEPIQIEGLDALHKRRDGSVELTVRKLQPRGSLHCRIDQHRFWECDDGFRIPLGELSRGEHRLHVEWRGGGSVMHDRSVRFCVESCDGLGRNGEVEPLPMPELQGFLLGGDYEIKVPPQMHVQQYATNFNPNARQKFYRISSESDPYTQTVEKCEAEFKDPFTATDGQGNRYRYCEITSTEKWYRWNTEDRYANNHIQLASNEAVVKRRGMQDVILVNVFNSEEEFTHTRSRFAELCRAARTTATGVPPIRKGPKIPMVRSEFEGVYRSSELWMCDVFMTTGNPLNGGLFMKWKIGAFYITEDGSPLPDLKCEEDCGFSSESILEVVYMSGVVHDDRGLEVGDNAFIKSAQETFLNILRAL